jgi:hypothetical protein
MPRRSLSQTSFYDPEVVQPDCLEAGTVPWLLARYRSSLFPSWLFRGWRGESVRGRKAWPAVSLVALLFLRWTEEGMSRLGSTRRARTDVAWRAAMGLHLQTSVPDEKTLREFEEFLRGRHSEAAVPRYLLLHEHIVRQCLEAGVVGDKSVWATDSTPMWCYGAVMDTARLLGDGTRMVAAKFGKATGKTVAEIAEEWEVPWILGKSIKGALNIDWRDADERTDAVGTLAHGALRAVEHVRRHIDDAPSKQRRRLLRRCRDLARVVHQDLEVDAQGRLVIAKRVAKDRIISLTDPSARHGRKSKSHTFDGFKLHVLGDVVSGLIASVTVTHGNQHDGSVAHRLIRRARALQREIEVVLGDTAYGGATLRHRVQQELDIKLIAPPPSPPKPSKTSLGRHDVIIDFDALTATCAAGITTDDHLRFFSTEYQQERSAFRWPKETCGACEIRTRCNGHRQGGHRINLHPHEQQLRKARRDWEDPRVRSIYRERSQCERLVNQLVRHGARRARGWGLGSAQLQAHLIAIRCNLQLLARAVAEHETQRAT